MPTKKWFSDNKVDIHKRSGAPEHIETYGKGGEYQRYRQPNDNFILRVEGGNAVGEGASAGCGFS